MATQIWKYMLSITDAQALQMPAGARVLTAAMRHGQLCVWALVDVNAPTESRRVYVRGTGHTFTGREGAYIASVQQAHGEFVWHVFDECR